LGVAAALIADVVDVPPLVGGLDLGPAEVGADLVDDGAHVGLGEVERVAVFVGGSPRGRGEGAFPREVEVVEV
jgi:hypothetical protein